ncbi:MAG TPA: DinB family protein [Thermoanaerobaculia bacterium]|nr:DinB family protein [Thermoanaerobaculia bacterium]
MTWEEVRQLHSEVAASLAASAERIPADRWLTPRAEGKWTPAEIVEHLNLVYDALLRELNGGGAMKIRTKWWHRVLLRWTLVPKLLRGEPFPAGARAPRETRPAAANRDQQAAVLGFRERAARLESSAQEALNSGPRRARLTHAYFGSATVKEGVLLCARHIVHHHQQMKESLS